MLSSWNHRDPLNVKQEVAHTSHLSAIDGEKEIDNHGSNSLLSYRGEHCSVLM